MKTCYYAHSKIIYGTKREKRERDQLEKQFKVVCPNRDMGELGSIEPYLNRIDKVDVVVASEVEGHVGRGVFAEVEYGITRKKQVFVLRGKNLYEVAITKTVDEDDWRLYYGKLIVRKLNKK